jgi:hypothetical protein
MAILKFLAVASFSVYAIMVLSLHQERVVPFQVEETGALQAATSHWRYRTPLGLIDSSLRQYFFDQALALHLPAEQAVEEAIHGSSIQTHNLVIASDGNGVGSIVAAELAFALFGPHARALPLLFALLVGISAACLLLRYRDERVSAVPTVLLAMGLLLITPLSSDVGSSQAAIGGIRNYAVVGILPALHWCFEFMDAGSPYRTVGLKRWALLFIQVAILGLSILVRGSPIYLLIPVIAGAAYALWRNRGKANQRPRLTVLFIPIAALLIGLTVLPRLAFPEYAKAGRLYNIVWHRVFISLSLHPDWPFPGVHEKFVCPEIPEGITKWGGDRNGHCAWIVYAHSHAMPSDILVAKVYDSDYEAALRGAFFDVIRAYPREALETFFYYKPRNTLQQSAAALRPYLSDATRSIGSLVALQLLLVIAFIGTRPPAAPLRDAGCRAAVLCLFLIPALVPQWIAWTSMTVSADLFAYLLCGCIIALWLGVSMMARLAMAGTVYLSRAITPST